MHSHAAIPYKSSSIINARSIPYYYENCFSDETFQFYHLMKADRTSVSLMKEKENTKVSPKLTANNASCECRSWGICSCSIYRRQTKSATLAK